MKKSMAVTVTADENSTKKLKSPKSNIDGSWAWVILFASVFNAVIATGQIASVNIYYVIFLEAFQQSSSFTAWIPAAQNTALCLNGKLIIE